MIPAHYLFSCPAGRRLHLGVSGSVAAYKSLDLLRAFTSIGLEVDVSLTSGARQFLTPLLFQSLGANVYAGMFAPDADPFGHLRPGQTAAAMLVCPATANILAKMAHGLAEDLLSCQALAFSGPLLVAPAMNARMWQSAATQANISILRQRGVLCIGPEQGTMACGESGNGRLAASGEIFIQTLRTLIPQDMAGKKVLLTLGPTREYFDAVRFWSNPSTGQMGACLAVAAWLRGAQVTVVCGPISLSLPTAISRHDVQSAAQMFEACHDLWPTMDIGCFSAAVADFAPVPYGPGKFKKEQTGTEPTFSFQATRDILRSIGDQKGSRQLIGFAAESTEHLQTNARRKLKQKNLDLIVANPVDQDGAGFAANSNRVWLLDRAGRSEQLPQLAKTDVAWRIWDWLRNM